MTPPTIEWVDNCDSTNSVLKRRGDSAPDGLTLAAREQTAGRGQRGNTWEAAPGKNLTFSVMLRPQGLTAERQFDFLMLTALAILNVLERRLGREAGLSLKWPNDIYAGNRKLGGILIEGVIGGGRVESMIVGAGINVNQTVFISDAPNPVSMVQIAGRTFVLEDLLEEIAEEICMQVGVYESDPDSEQLREIYKSVLWRRSGLHPYRDTRSGECFDAEIADVLPTGILRLLHADGSLHDYEFKEIAALLQ